MVENPGRIVLPEAPPTCPAHATRPPADTSHTHFAREAPAPKKVEKAHNFCCCCQGGHLSDKGARNLGKSLEVLRNKMDPSIAYSLILGPHICVPNWGGGLSLALGLQDDVLQRGADRSVGFAVRRSGPT